MAACVDATACAILVYSCLDIHGGFWKGALEVQTTEQVFFPLHIVNMRVWWQLFQLGAYPTILQKKKQQFLANVASTPVPGFRCGGCGLLRQTARKLHDHVVECHMSQSGLLLQNPNLTEALLNPRRVVRNPTQENVVSLAVSANMTLNSFPALALSECGVVPSLLDVGGLVRMFVHMATFVTMPVAMDDNDDDNARPGLRLAVWYFWFIAVLGSMNISGCYRLMPRWWRFIPTYIFAGQWQGCSVEGFVPRISTIEATRLRSCTDVQKAGQRVLQCAESCREYVYVVCQNFHTSFGIAWDTYQEHGERCCNISRLVTTDFHRLTLAVWSAGHQVRRRFLEASNVWSGFAVGLHCSPDGHF